MWLTVLAICVIAVLAWLIRKAAKGTAFEHKCPCTPYIEHLRGLEKEGDQVHKRENLW